jgi:hypothetical protein
VLTSSKSRGNELSLFYHKSEQDAAEKREPLGEIVLNEIKSVTARKDKGEGRFDVEVPGRVFSLRCEREAELKKWLATLNSMTQMASFQKPSALPATPAETMRLMAANSAAAGGKVDSSFGADATVTVDLMSKGQAFIRYEHEHVTEKTTRSIVNVFFKKDATPLGSLYFCEPGTMDEDPNTALALHSLTDLFLGQ